ncbi:MAG: hypothetical protein ACT4OF_04695 [Caulobacteraceae bacterium]
MLTWLMAAMAAGAVVLTAAWAQEARPSSRYIGCRAAEDVDRRLHEICEVIDSIHSRLEAARGQPRRIAELQNARAMALMVILDTGDELAARDCIEASRASAEFYTRARTPTRWAALQLNVGSSLTALGAMGDQAALQEAVPVVAAAIEAIRRSRQPELWAYAHEALASAHLMRARAGNQEQEFRQAAAALRSALEIYRRPSFAEKRARAEQRLAEIYRALGEEPGQT